MPLPPDFYRTVSSLNDLPQAPAIQRILSTALSAVDPAAAVARALRRDGDLLWLGDEAFPLGPPGRVLLIGAGKAALPMGRAVLDVLAGWDVRGLLITKEGYGGSLGTDAMAVWEAGHPQPDARGEAATRRLLGMLEGLTSRDLVIALISGGGSALLTAPAPGVSLDDLRALTGLLLRSGADIHQLNTVRRHLDVVKGGGLARACAPARVIALVLSDVLGDPLADIASGPLAPDDTRYADAWQVLRQYDLLDLAPAGVLARLQAGMEGRLPGNPPADDTLFTRVRSRVIAANGVAARAALEQAHREGFQAQLLTTFLQGEAHEAGRFAAALLRQLRAGPVPLRQPACLILGGETTVTVRGDGLGGRCSELALGAVQDLAGLPGVLLLTLATDGGDGPTDAAGAAVTGSTLARARALGLDPRAYLARNDAYSFFAALGDLLRTGPTRTNVNDLLFLFAWDGEP